jgi:aldehyde dehydrogenase (NAD+)
MLVPHERLEEATALAVQAAEAIRIGSPSDALTNMGPLSTRAQFEKVQRLIQQGIDEGATLACGGLGRPHGLDSGYFVRPTVFTNVDNRMVIAREEIFGPVLCVIPYGDEEDAIRIANDTCYGLGAFIQSADLERARRVARRLRAGNVQINYPAVDRGAPFGGYGHSGNGREWGEFGLLEYLEVKGIQGFTPGVS